ncbi:hypothetical protein H310_05984 [Aphanomyces invadans]|uniref:Uncharacterized protein n=1 Tax=Aphanomyces invadans TaxID=157072 RepID=A0A024UA60_9STRA|nr:hypothetical protein H310_05984 [Aphanomyces invadans]ETW02483.1 hypothetical protein H310_05984 [Aphanomyces invadans]|eukprot:XP_008869088.1 hypothetical protein H310_05984 [Aphanomyces invadans]
MESLNASAIDQEVQPVESVDHNDLEAAPEIGTIDVVNAMHSMTTVVAMDEDAPNNVPNIEREMKKIPRKMNLVIRQIAATTLVGVLTDATMHDGLNPIAAMGKLTLTCLHWTMTHE